MKRTIVAIVLILTVVATEGCSLFRHHKETTPQPTPPSHAAVQPAKRPQARASITSRPYIYTYEVAWSARTEQFIVVPRSPEVKPLERAHTIRLKMPACPLQSGRPARPSTKPISAIEPKAKHALAASAGGATAKTHLPLLSTKPTARTLEVTVHFDLNSAHIRAAEAHKLHRFPAQLKREAARGPYRVDVAGYTCWLSPKDLNDRLALARAMAVVRVLRKEGVKVSSVSARGKCCYIPACRRQSGRDRLRPGPNRRAEVRATFERKEVKAKGMT